MQRSIIHAVCLAGVMMSQLYSQDATPEGKVYNSGGDVRAPNLISKVEPEYSEEARKAKISGSVRLSVIVAPDGIPREITVVRGIGYQLDEEAVKAVGKWRFRPGMKDGQPVAVRAMIEVSFRLLDKAPSADAPPNFGREPATAEEAYRRGFRLYRDRGFEAAIAMYSKALAMKQDWAEAMIAKGYAEAAAGKYSAAIEDYTKAIQLDGTNPSWFYSRGVAYRLAGMKDKALEDFNHSIEMSPLPNPASLDERGRLYMDAGQTEKAMADLSRAIKENPAFTEAYRNRAQAYAGQKDWVHALADCNAVIELDPDSNAYRKRAEVEQAKGDGVAADADRRKAAELAPPAK